MRKWLAIGASRRAGARVVACGSDDNNSSSSASTIGGDCGRRRHDLRRRRDVPAARLRRVGRRFKDKHGHTVNYNAIGSGGGVAQFTANTVDFGATDSAMTDEEVKARQEEGRAGPRSRPCSARSPSPTTCPACKGLKLDGADDRRHLPRQDQEVERPGDHEAEPGREPARPEHHGRPPLRRVGHDEAVHDLPGRLQPRVEERPGRRQDGQVADRHRRQGQRRRRRRASSRPTDAVGYVEQAYALQNNFTTADVKNKSGSSSRRRSSRPRRPARASRSRPTCASARSTRRAPKAYPIASATFLLVYKDMCKAGKSKDSGPAGQVTGWTTRSATARRWRRSCSTRRCPPQHPRPRRRPRSTALHCNGQPEGAT